VNQPNRFDKTVPCGTLRRRRCGQNVSLSHGGRTPRIGRRCGGVGRVGDIERRKADHIRINLEQDVSFDRLTTGLERYRFIHQALPEIDLAQVDLSTGILGKQMRAPLLISSMTGGTERAHVINQYLATAAQEAGIAMGLGSLRAALEDRALATSFSVRQVAPDILLLANLGAVQLNYGFTVDDCRRAVELVGADALILHLNALQEALQPGGDTNFTGLLRRIEDVCRRLGVPVVVKEVGWGISENAARRLAEAGVAAIDVAGAGGTSWSQVEMHRAGKEPERRVASAFRDWGIPTADSIRMVRKGAPGVTIIASGGLRDGIDVAKTLALGARLAGMTRPFLEAALVSSEAVLEVIHATVTELRVAMFCIGARKLDDLFDTPSLVEVRS
jgi:isopentenyl-diphosphate delta-isomerase